MELINIRVRTSPEESACDARLLSRLSLEGVPSTEDLAKALAGLALLAMLPRVKGQPLEDQVGLGSRWAQWFIGVLVTALALIWGWWRLSSAPEGGPPEVFSEASEESLESENYEGCLEASVEDQQVCQGMGLEGPVDKDEEVPQQPESPNQCSGEVDGADDVFSDAE